VWRIRDVYPGSRILIFTHPGSRIPDPKTVTKERGEKNLLSYFFCSHKFHKIEYYVIFEMLKKKIWANLQRIVEVFTQKIFNMLSNIWVWDPGSGKNLFRIPGSKRHRIPDPQHWFTVSVSPEKFSSPALSWLIHHHVFNNIKLFYPDPRSGIIWRWITQ
jgi:hypothetical protein